MLNDPQALADLLKAPQYDSLLSEKYGFQKIDRNLLKICSEAIRELELSFKKWNELNQQRFQGKYTDGEIIKSPSVPRIPQPYSSWAEFRMSVFGGMQEMQYEAIELTFTVEKKHISDWHDSLNNRILYQGKGVISTLDMARDLICVAKQNAVHHVFIFTVPNIHCPWARPRKDGSVMTQEEWAKKEGFDFIYEGQEMEFLKGARRKWLVENFAKNLPPLKLRQARVLEDSISVNPALFAHKQQSASVTMTVQ